MLTTMDAARIAALLEPFLGGEPVSPNLATQLQTYLDLLLRWNARINLTAVRDPEQIVTRHFGESLFAARLLRDAGAPCRTSHVGRRRLRRWISRHPHQALRPRSAAHADRIAKQEGDISARGHPHAWPRRRRSFLRPRGKLEPHRRPSSPCAPSRSSSAPCQWPPSSSPTRDTVPADRSEPSPSPAEASAPNGGSNLRSHSPQRRAGRVNGRTCAAIDDSYSRRLVGICGRDTMHQTYQWEITWFLEFSALAMTDGH